MDDFNEVHRPGIVKTSFVVDFGGKEGLTDMTIVDAYGVYVTNTGDLLFYDQSGYPFDMWGAGHWKRCKIGRME